MEEFTIYPAIDLRDGKVVRLLRGDPDHQTTYGNDPAEVARHWLACGATWLHIINLDGALGEADHTNLKALQGIMDGIRKTSSSIRIQFGGGLRSLSDIDRALSSGVDRIILGTAAIDSPELVQTTIERYGTQRIALAMDAQGDKIAVHGWAQTTAVHPIKLGIHFYKMGLRTAIFTDINRDGTGSGVNVERSRQVAAATHLNVIAAGGVASLADVQRVREAGLSGVIIGRALYDGTIDLEEALAC